MKKIISALLVFVMVLSLCSCGFTGAGSNEQTAQTAEKEGVAPVGVANPISEETAESLLEKTGFDMSNLKDYSGIRYSMINAESLTAQADFTVDGDEYCYRIAGTAEYTDISGMYHTWAEESTCSVGYNTADIRISGEGAGVILWYDIVPGVMYSLSMSENAAAEKLEKTANAVWYPTQGDADGEAAAETGAEYEQALTAALTELFLNYHPGTAGSSLSSAKYAARLADIFTLYNVSGDSLSAIISSLAGGMDSSSKEIMTSQLMGVNASFIDMCDNGVEILETAGAEAEQYPWDRASLSPLFDLAITEASNYAYDGIIEEYVTAVREKWDWEALNNANMNYMARDCELDGIGYAIRDLDGDGVKDLLICPIAGEENAFFCNMVFELRTIDDFGYSKQVILSGERNRWYYCGDKLFRHEGSSGASDSFLNYEEFSKGELSDSTITEHELVSPELIPFSNY